MSILGLLRNQKEVVDSHAAVTASTSKVCALVLKQAELIDSIQHTISKIQSLKSGA